MNKLSIDGMGDIKAFGDNIIVIPLLTSERKKLFRGDNESDQIIMPNEISEQQSSINIGNTGGSIDIDYSVPIKRAPITLLTNMYKFGKNDCYEGIVYSCGNDKLPSNNTMIVGFGGFSVVLNRLKYNLDRDWLIINWFDIYYWIDKKDYYGRSL